MALRTAKQQAEALRRQQGVLAEFGRQALRTDEIQELLQRATELVSSALEIDLVKILELRPDRKSMLVRAGVNWAPGVVGHAIIEADGGSAAGYALRSGEPVISLDIENEKRFTIPQLLRDHDVKSTINVVIQGEHDPFGILEVDAQRHVDFTQDDVNFLQNYANLLAGAIDRVSAHGQISLMLSELQHRMQNMMAKIQAIARRTAATSSDMSDFTKRFDVRLGALARSQDILVRGAGDAASLRALLTSELGALGGLDGKRISIDGDDITIQGKDTWAFSLIFHELATNAQKYGALRPGKGQINISWSMDEATGKVRISWRELDVEIAARPTRKSFGSEIVEKVIPSSLNGSSTLTFHPDGIEYVLEFPMPKA